MKFKSVNNLRVSQSVSANTEAVIASSNDEDLMLRYQNADYEAFTEIYARYNRKIYHFLMRRLGNPDDCAELFQETFFRVHRGRSSYRSGMCFRTWLYTIANNLVRDSLRSKMRYKPSPPTDRLRHGIDGVIPDGNYKLQVFKQAFDGLSDDQKEAIVLSRFEGLKYEEIARVTGRSTDAVNQLIQRGLRRLREYADDF